jgi:hypothetical protein
MAAAYGPARPAGVNAFDAISRCQAGSAFRGHPEDLRDLALRRSGNLPSRERCQRQER